MRRFTLRKSTSPIHPGSAENIAFFDKKGAPLDLASKPKGWVANNIVVDPAQAVPSVGDGGASDPEGGTVVLIGPTLPWPSYGDLILTGFEAMIIDDALPDFPNPPIEIGKAPVLNGEMISGFDGSSFAGSGEGRFQAGDSLYGQLNSEPDLPAEYFGIGMRFAIRFLPNRPGWSSFSCAFPSDGRLLFRTFAGDTYGSTMQLVNDLTQESVQAELDALHGEGVATVTNFVLNPATPGAGFDEPGYFSISVGFAGPDAATLATDQSGRFEVVSDGNLSDVQEHYQTPIVAHTTPITISKIVAIHHIGEITSL